MKRIAPHLAHCALAIIAATALCLMMALPVSAQGDLEDVLGNIGSASAVDKDAPATEAAAGHGSVAGQVFDSEAGVPVSGVSVIVVWPDPGDGSEPRQEVQLTDPDGAFTFPSIPEGSYSLSFVKSGYRASTMTDFQVVAGQLNRADFPMPPLPTEEGREVLDLEAFVVEASTVSEIMTSLELRLESDELLNIMSAEDLSRFAASDVADALKRVAGVNIVEGQFAIIRGLEDRYSSTLFNGAPVPSPDPESQSVQLDLFPAEVVSNLVVAKTFGADAPGNSAGGTIDIRTDQYTEDNFFIEFSAGAGLEDRAQDTFLRYNDQSSTGGDRSNPFETDFKVSAGGNNELFGRNVRFKAILSNEIDYSTSEGFQETREPRRRNLLITPPFGFEVAGLREEQSGDLAFGELNLSEGLFELTQSERVLQRTAFSGLGFDLDTEGNHTIDFTFFDTKKEEEIVQHKENGFIPGFDYDVFVDDTLQGEAVSADSFNNFATPGSWIAFNINSDEGGRTSSPLRGHQWLSNVNEGRGVDRERSLTLFQINGSHRWDRFEGLEINWVANTARTDQEEFGLRNRIFNTSPDLAFIPETYPITERDGVFAINDDILLSDTEIEENQNFARLDISYERSLFGFVDWTIRAGGWYENSDRDVGASFLGDGVLFDQERCRFERDICLANFSQGIALGDSFEEVGTNLIPSLAVDPDTDRLVNLQLSSNESERRVWSFNFDTKLTFWDVFDVFGGFRVESLRLTSANDARAFDRNGDPKVILGAPEVFPSRYLFFDRLDNSVTRTEGTAVPGTVFNDEILGLDVQIDPATGFVDVDDPNSLIDGELDERFFLPTIGVGYRPFEGVNLRLAYSKTVARPSFRELGYYVTIPVDSSGLEVGNPQLDVSRVESFDARLEYTWGDQGDLVAFSVFHKTIEDPIEKIVLRDPTINDSTSFAFYRTWFNNQTDADLLGFEFEARKNLGFLAGKIFGYQPIKSEFPSYFSIGGNFTYIDAEVERGFATLARSEGFFGTTEADGLARFGGLEEKRRLFGQPEWIANVDLSFDHPAWGTKATLALFSISDVLNAAGVAQIAPNRQVNSLILDQFTDGFSQLDLVFSQSFGFLRPGKETFEPLVLKFSAKNLLDSQRGVLYDPEQTSSDIYERRFRSGRDYSVSLSYRRTF